MGVVLENQIGGSPVKNVSITALGANQTTTGNDGQFSLRFAKHLPGEDVNIIVSRSGWVVVNDIQLERSLPANAARSPLKILICKTAEREQWTLQFYRLKGYQVADATYKKKLEGSNAAGVKERDRLLRERNQARTQIDEMARKLANRPADGMDVGYRNAMSLFLDGKIDEALDILSEERLREQAKDIKKKQKQIIQKWLLRGQMLALL